MTLLLIKLYAFAAKSRSLCEDTQVGFNIYMSFYNILVLFSGKTKESMILEKYQVGFCVNMKCFKVLHFYEKVDVEPEFKKEHIINGSFIFRDPNMFPLVIGFLIVIFHL